MDPGPDERVREAPVRVRLTRSGPAPGLPKARYRGAPLPGPVAIRELRWTDFESLVDIYFELYDEREQDPLLGIHLFHDRPTRESEITWFSDLFVRVLRGEAVVAVAEEDGRAVGNCTVGGVGPQDPRSETSHVGVLGILVDRRYRGRGIGHALLVRALEEARGRFERVRLTVFATNERARHLYEQVGFRVSGRLEGEVKRGDRYLDLDELSLDLTAWKPPGT